MTNEQMRTIISFPFFELKESEHPCSCIWSTIFFEEFVSLPVLEVGKSLEDSPSVTVPIIFQKFCTDLSSQVTHRPRILFNIIGYLLLSFLESFITCEEFFGRRVTT
jgi:hypothetical protein